MQWAIMAHSENSFGIIVWGECEVPYTKKQIKLLCYNYPKTGDSLGVFWPQGHNLDTIGRGLLDDATYQISRPFFLVFPIKPI